jgi:hypothetical protein
MDHYYESKDEQSTVNTEHHPKVEQVASFASSQQLDRMRSFPMSLEDPFLHKERSTPQGDACWGYPPFTHKFQSFAFFFPHAVRWIPLKALEIFQKVSWKVGEKVKIAEHVRRTNHYPVRPQAVQLDSCADCFAHASRLLLTHLLLTSCC